jgi:hypothetical protein
MLISHVTMAVDIAGFPDAPAGGIDQRYVQPELGLRAQ